MAKWTGLEPEKTQPSSRQTALDKPLTN